MCTQKNRLNETVLLSTQNICLNCWVRKLLHFYARKLCLTGPLIMYLSACVIIFVGHTFGVPSIILEGMHQFQSKFAER